MVVDLQRLINKLASVDWLDGISLADVELAAGANEIQHTLGRKPRGWWVLRFSGAAASDYPRESAATSKILTLTVTNAATVSLWVY